MKVKVSIVKKKGVVMLQYYPEDEAVKKTYNKLITTNPEYSLLMAYPVI